MYDGPLFQSAGGAGINLDSAFSRRSKIMVVVVIIVASLPFNDTIVTLHFFQSNHTQWGLDLLLNLLGTASASSTSQLGI